MIVFGRQRKGLSPLMRKAGKRGFEALALDGADIINAIAEEQSEGILTRAVSIARQYDERTWAGAPPASRIGKSVGVGCGGTDSDGRDG